MRINHNIPALNAFRNLSFNSSESMKIMEKLSSGLRINRAADDAAGLAISETMRGQIKGLTQAARNAQDAISLIQTAEGALIETHAMLQQMRELAVCAANETYTSMDGMEIQKEIDRLREEIDRIATTTHFNHKNLLDGTLSALVSTDKLSTKVLMRGGLRLVDQFGQKITGAGNYKIEIAADAGTAQIQKSGIFKQKHGGDSVQALSIDENSGIEHLSATNVAKGSYQVQTVNNILSADAAEAAVSGQIFRSDGGNMFVTNSVSGNTIGGASSINASILMEVMTVATGGGAVTSITVKFSWYEFNKAGEYLNSAGVFATTGNIKLNTTTKTLDSAFMAATSLTNIGTRIQLGFNIVSAGIAVGDKATINFMASQNNTSGLFNTVNIRYHASENVPSGTAYTSGINWRFRNDVLNNKTNQFYFFSLNSSGKAYSGSVDLTFGGVGSSTAASGTDHTTFRFLAGLGKVASLDTKLRDIDKFWDGNGKFLLNEPQVITLIQGNGKQYSFALFGEDTLRSVIAKFNSAVVDGLGQGEYVSAADRSKFVSYVTKGDPAGIETVEGTMVIRSVIAGKEGEINVVGGEPIMNAFSLAEVQAATANQFTIDVTDAHDENKIIAAKVKVTGNMLVGVIHPNVDVKFDPNADINVSFDATTKKFILAEDTVHDYTTFVHLIDKTLIYQIGANQMQDMGSAIGDMSAEALGVHQVFVTDRVSAGRSITILDQAIARVSTQRSSLGAVQNRLEHTINNLGVAHENLTAAESRIRDVDMATAMMDFSKLNILAQASSAMLTQANQKPQLVLQLLRR